MSVWVTILFLAQGSRLRLDTCLCRGSSVPLVTVLALVLTLSAGSGLASVSFGIGRGHYLDPPSVGERPCFPGPMGVVGG